MKHPRKFPLMAKFLRKERDVVGLSQIKVSNRLGFKNGQYISNVEREKCSIPVEKIWPLSKALDLGASKIIDVMVAEYREFLETTVYRI